MNVNGDQQFSFFYHEETGEKSSRPPARKGEGSLVLREYAQAIVRISAALNTPTDPFTVAREITEECATLFSASMASFFMAADHDLKYVAGFGLPPGFIRQIEEIGRTEAASRYLAGVSEPVVFHVKDNDPGLAVLKELATSVGVSTIAWAPIINQQKLLGIMTLYHKAERSYNQDDLDCLCILTNCMALATASANRVEAQREEDRARERFLNALSHELRTPLTSIMGFAQILRKRFANAPLADGRLLDQIETLWTQAQRLTRLIDTFVDLSHIEQGEFALQVGKVELERVIKSAVDQSVKQSRSKHHIELDLPDHPVWVHGDDRRLSLVFMHLLSNAIRYSPTDQPITVSCEDHSSKGQVSVSVTDKGPGIPPARRRHVFERFQRGDVAKSGGLGVGLFITKTIVEAHGGHISLQSSPHHGTKITIVLPV